MRELRPRGRGLLLPRVTVRLKCHALVSVARLRPLQGVLAGLQLPGECGDLCRQLFALERGGLDRRVALAEPLGDLVGTPLGFGEPPRERSSFFDGALKVSCQGDAVAGECRHLAAQLRPVGLQLSDSRSMGDIGLGGALACLGERGAQRPALVEQLLTFVSDLLELRCEGGDLGALCGMSLLPGHLGFLSARLLRAQKHQLLVARRERLHVGIEFAAHGAELVRPAFARGLCSRALAAQLLLNLKLLGAFLFERAAQGRGFGRGTGARRLSARRGAPGLFVEGRQAPQLGTRRLQLRAGPVAGNRSTAVVAIQRRQLLAPLRQLSPQLGGLLLPPLAIRLDRAAFVGVPRLRAIERFLGRVQLTG